MNSNLSDPAFWSRLQKSMDQEGTRESSLNANLAFGSFSITPGRILAFLITVSYYITAGKGPSMIAPVLRLTGTRSRAMKTLDTISSNSKTWPNSLTSSFPPLVAGQTFIIRSKAMIVLRLVARSP